MLKKQILWAQSALPEYALDVVPGGDQWYIPARVAALVRPGRDVVILPGGSEPVREFAGFIQRTLRVYPEQMFFTSGEHFVMDEDIASLLPRLRHRCQRLSSWIVAPYSVLPAFSQWAEPLGIEVFGDTYEFFRSSGHKGILHPRFGAVDTDHRVLTRGEHIIAPRGVVCHHIEELVTAYRHLSERFEMILKPVFGSAGEGIASVSKHMIRDYAFPLGPVILEERLWVDRVGDAEVACSVQFNRGALFGAVTDQLINGHGWSGNIVPSCQSDDFQRQVRRSARAALKQLRSWGLNGPGGFDFLSVEGKPVLVDINVGRFTGAHSPKIFHALYASKHSVLMNWKIHPRVGHSVEDLWGRLRQKGIAFDPYAGKDQGVFPLCYLRGIWGMLLAIAPTHQRAHELREEATECWG